MQKKEKKEEKEDFSFGPKAIDRLAYSPYLSVGGWSLSDDRAGLRRGQGLLDHDAGVMVGHPRVGMLVLALACLAMQGEVLQRGRTKAGRGFRIGEKGCFL